MNWNNYECDGQISIFDLEESIETKFNPIEALALHGTGFHDGMKRVLQYFSENHSIKEKASFLKKEYGIGGFGSPVKKLCIIHEMCTFSSGKDIAFAYYDENLNNIETNCTWEQLAKTITEMIHKNTYEIKR